MAKVLRFRGQVIKAISFDVTGTLLVHRHAIAKTYADAAAWAMLPDAPTEEEFHPAFKQAYKETLQDFPFFRHPSSKWWKAMLGRTIAITGREYSDAMFDRFYLRVYQTYGARKAYEVLEDAVPFLDFLEARNVLKGIISNTPARTEDNTLPMLGLHNFFKFFVTCQRFGDYKPSPAIFEKAHQHAVFWVPGIHPKEILHIGDNEAQDYCGARAAGFSAALLKRKGVTAVYNEWLSGPDYEGKSEGDVEQHSFVDLSAVQQELTWG